MDPSTKLVSLFLLLALFSMKIHGRESFFFSKVTHSNSNNNSPLQKTTVPNKEEQDPAFYPETHGYGLDDHDSSELPATTTTDVPYKYTTDDKYYSNDNEYSNNAFEEQRQNSGERHTTRTNQYNDAGNGERQGKQRTNNYNGANRYNGAERQGMSDTRFLENGKYYYDVKGENSHYPNQNQNQNQNSRYYNNGRGGYNGPYPTRANQYKNTRYNDENSNYEYNKSMQRYQDQDDFEERQEEQYEP